MNLEVLCWYTWHTSILSFLAMLEMGSGSDIAKDMHLQSFFWKRAYPQKHISASWCCFTTQSGCHRCNLSVSSNSGWTDTVRNSLSSFTFIGVFRLFVKAEGLKTFILEHAESLPDCLHPALGAFGYCRWKSAFSLLLFETFLVDWSVYLLYVLTNSFFFTNQIQHIWRHHLPDMLPCVALAVGRWWVTSLQKTILQSYFLSFGWPHCHRRIPCFVAQGWCFP